MKVPTNHFVATGKSATELKTFLDKVGDDTKIIGKKNNKGETVLFVKPNKTSVLARITGAHAERKRLAKEAMGSILDQSQNKIGGKATGGEIADMFSELKDRIDQTPTKASLVAKNLKSMADGLAVLEDKADTVMKAPTQPGANFESVLPAALQGKAEQATTTIKVNGRDVDMPHITLGDGASKRTFEPEKHLTDGGFGAIYVYKDVNAPNEKIVLKTALNAKASSAVEQEAMKHGEIGGGQNKHENVLEMKAAVRLPDGTAALVLEHAPNGNLSDFAKGLKGSEGDGPGKTPQALADVIRARQLHEVASGFLHINEQGVAQRDPKGDNVLLDAKFKAKVSDLGEAETVPDDGVLPASTYRNLSPFNSSPELLQANNDLDAIGDRKADIGKEKTAITDAVTLLGVTRGKKALITELTKPVAEHFADVERDDKKDVTVAAQKADDWGFGSIAVEVITGSPMLINEEALNSEVANKILNRQGDAVGPRKSDGRLREGALLAPTNNKDFDDLLNGMFEKDAGERLSIEDALTHPALNLPGMFSPAVEQFLPFQATMNDKYVELAAIERNLDQANALLTLNPTPAMQSSVNQFLADANAKRAEIAQFAPAFDQAKTAALAAIADEQRARLTPDVALQQLLFM